MKLYDGKAFNLILLGDVGAGKATQAQYLVAKYGMFDFDMGLELSKLRQKNSKIDSVQKRTADKGILTPTNIVREILQSKILSTPKSRGILFDGTPKMLGEAKLVAKLIKSTGRSKPLLMYIKIPAEETIKRVTLGRGYDHTRVKKRSDDTAQGLRNRARYYRKNIQQVIKYFKSQYEFALIDGMGSKAQVRARIQKAINAYLKKHGQVHQKTRRN